MAVRDGEDGLTMVASVAGELVGRRWTREEDFLTDEIVLEEQELDLPASSLVVKTLLIGADQRWLYLIGEAGEFQVVDLGSNQVVSQGKLISSGIVTQARFLLGGISLLVASDQGEVSQWFMVREEGREPRLEKIREFKHGDTVIQQLLIEHRRKGLVTIDEEGVMDIYHSTAHRHLLSEPLGKDVRKVALSPRAHAFLLQHDNGEFSFLEYA